MQWDDSPNAGFTAGTPWFKVNENFREVNVKAALEDPDSVFYFYQRLIALRKTCPVFRDGEFTLLLPEDEALFVYTRETDAERLLVVCNMSGEEREFDLPAGFENATTLIANYPGAVGVLRPWEARILYVGGKA